jgi:GT2 family glycosyltransferase
MIRQPPTVSIVIPIKGRPDLFAATARSLRLQTFAEWEAVVVDDHSAEKDFQRIAAIAGTDPRMRLVRRAGPRCGASACRNAGLDASAGRYVIFLDADDLLAPGCLKRRVEVMEQNPAADFAVFLTAIFLDVPGDTPLFWNAFKEGDDIERFLCLDSPWQTTGPIWRRTALQRLGPWDERVRCWQDLEFHVRSLALGLNYLKVPEADCYYRKTQPGSISFKSTSTRYHFNRVRVLAGMAACLKANGKLTPRRRHILAGHFCHYAFRSKQRRQTARKIWRYGWRRAGVVTPVEYAAILAWRTILAAVERMNRAFERFLYPESALIWRGVSTFVKSKDRQPPDSGLIQELEQQRNPCPPPADRIQIQNDNPNQNGPP